MSTIPKTNHRTAAKDVAPLVSLVIPVYNEQESLPELAEGIDVLIADADYRFEVLCVDDGSNDQSLAIMLKLRDADPRYKVICLGRNFGNQAAFCAGLDHAQGDAVVLLNADLQDPPELVGEFLVHWRAGYDVVYAVRESRSESWLKRLEFNTFYRLLNKMSHLSMPLDAGCFGLLDRTCVDIINNMPEQHRYIPGLRQWVGFNQVGVPYRRPPRFAGHESDFKSQMAFALDAIFAFSFAPLKWIFYVGVSVSLTSFTVIVYQSLNMLLLTHEPLGATTIVAAIMFVGGSILVALGVISAYIARIYDEVRARPQYTIKHKYD